jgi:Ni,Fe-hydrogenase I cytochrome b subunit
MEPPSPVRLFATVAGAALFVYGIAGFFFDASFAAPDDVGEALSLTSVNGWANTFHLFTGALGLLLAGFAARRYALAVAALYALVALGAAV